MPARVIGLLILAAFAAGPAVAADLPVVTPSGVPAGGESLAVEWLRITTAGSGSMLAAVARPQGAGPFATVILLHGSHGFAREYVEMAQGLARAGVLAVAACWSSGGGGAGARFVTPIACPDAHPMEAAADAATQRALDALVNAVRHLPGVRGDRIVLFGHSRGGGAALQYLLHTGGVQGAVLNSAGYPDELVPRAAEVKVPLLMLHGTADGAGEGGSPVTDPRQARAFEAALRRAGKRVEATFYDGAGHNGIFASNSQRDDSLRRIAAFVNSLAR